MLKRVSAISIFFIISLTGAFFIACMTSYVRGIDFSSALFFLLYRVFFMTAYGDQCFLFFNDQIPFDLLSYGLHNFFGDFSNIFYSTDKLSDNLNVAISYACYPDKSIVLSGISNLTVTGFSELIFLFGYFSVFIVAILGTLSGWLLASIKYSFQVGDELFLSFKLTIFFSVLLVWLNSGSLFSLFSFFNIIYLSSTLFFIYLLRAMLKK